MGDETNNNTYEQRTSQQIQLSSIPVDFNNDDINIPTDNEIYDNNTFDDDDDIIIPGDDFEGDISNYDTSTNMTNLTQLSTKTENLSITNTSINSSANGNTNNIIKKNINEWNSIQINRFLENINLVIYFSLFKYKNWLTGDKLIKLDEDTLYEESINYFRNNINKNNNGTTNNNNNNSNIDSNSFEKIIKNECKKIIREISKLMDNEYDDIVDDTLNIGDIQEFERRLFVFIEKWERIDWIDEYTRDWNGRLPTIETIEEELDIPNYVAIELLSSYKSREKEEEIDLNKLFEGIDISDHGVIWWSIVLGKLQIKQVDSYLIVLRYILRYMSIL